MEVLSARFCGLKSIPVAVSVVRRGVKVICYDPNPGERATNVFDQRISQKDFEVGISVLSVGDIYSNPQRPYYLAALCGFKM